VAICPGLRALVSSLPPAVVSAAAHTTRLLCLAALRGAELTTAPPPPAPAPPAPNTWYCTFMPESGCHPVSAPSLPRGPRRLAGLEGRRRARRGGQGKARRGCAPDGEVGLVCAGGGEGGADEAVVDPRGRLAVRRVLQVELPLDVAARARVDKSASGVPRPRCKRSRTWFSAPAADTKPSPTAQAPWHCMVSAA
jgi:hypothetical protein